MKLMFAQAEAVVQQGEYRRAQDIDGNLNRYVWAAMGRPGSIRNVYRLHIDLARIHALQGDWQTALVYWERAQRMYEKHPQNCDFVTVDAYAVIAYSHLR